MNQIIVAMDMEIPNGFKLMSEIRTSKQVYGYKIGSLWILDRSKDILRIFRRHLNSVFESTDSDHKIILDMQKWGTDIPDIIKKQVEKVAPYVDELICCPMGAGSESLKMFAKTCIDNNVKPICVLEMTHPNADSYLHYHAYMSILHNAMFSGIRNFVIPATKEPKNDIKEMIKLRYGYDIDIDFYATGFKVQEGQIKPMVDFGVTKFIVGRAIYEAENPIKAVEDIYREINEE